PCELPNKLPVSNKRFDQPEKNSKLRRGGIISSNLWFATEISVNSVLSGGSFSARLLIVLRTQGLPSHLASHHPPDSERILVFEFIRESSVRKPLVADWPRESKDCSRPHRSRPAIRSCRERPAMDHRVAHLDSGRESVKDQPANLVLENMDQVSIFLQISFSTMERSGEMAFEPPGYIEKLLPIGMRHQDSRRTKNFRAQLRIR